MEGNFRGDIGIRPAEITPEKEERTRALITKAKEIIADGVQSWENEELRLVVGQLDGMKHNLAAIRRYVEEEKGDLEREIDAVRLEIDDAIRLAQGKK